MLSSALASFLISGVSQPWYISLPRPIKVATSRRHVRTLAAAALLILTVLAASRPANSAISPAAICEASKLATAGKYGACRLQRASKATARDEAPFLEKCKGKFPPRWAKIEAKGGGTCPTLGDAETISTAVGEATDAAEVATTSSVEMARCAAFQQKSLGKYLSCTLAAYAKARKSGLPLSIARCASTLDKSSVAAMHKFTSACFLTSLQTVRGDLDVRVADIADRLSGAAPPPQSPRCGDGKFQPPAEECDGADALKCPGACRADCTCPNQAARVNLFARVAKTGGRPGHEGLVPTQPVPGQTAYIVATVMGPYGTAAFRLLDASDHLIQAVALQQDRPGHYVGEVTIPAQPFKIAVSGATRDGTAYDVVGTTLFAPQPIELIWDMRSINHLPPGGTTTLRFTLLNHGAADTFNLSASDTLGLGRVITPNTVPLATDETASVTVEVSAPSSPPPFKTGSVILTATSSSNPNTTTASAVLVDLR